MLHDELGPDGFVVRDAVPTSDVIRIRFGDIDGLRALAIFLVAFAATVQYTVHDPAPVLVRIAQAAGQGLALFLVISGFALAFPAMAVLRQDGRTYIDIARYAIRRVLRIYPAYLVALVLTVAAAAFTQKLAPAGLQNVTPGGVIASLFFIGNGFGNVGFQALELFARAYIVFPLLLILWTRQPAIFIALAVVLGIVDYATPLHAWNLAAFVPFMLGIIAADLRAQVHRIERFAPILTVVSAAIAIFLATRVSDAIGAQSSGLSIDFFWSLAAFGLLVSTAAYRPLEKAFSFWMLRVVGASSYAISLTLVPTLGVLAALIPRYAVAFAAPATLIAGFAFWQIVDRWFDDSSFRRTIATSISAPIDALLSKLHIARVFLGTVAPEEDHHESEEEFVPNFYAPPPRAGAADLAIVSRRTGSPEELAAEISETKARLAERSAAIFGDMDPEFSNANGGPVFAKPGFYRKPPKHVDAEPLGVAYAEHDNGASYEAAFEPKDETHHDPEREPESAPFAQHPIETVDDPFAHHVLEAIDDPFAEPQPEAAAVVVQAHDQSAAAQVVEPQAESNVEHFAQSFTPEPIVEAAHTPSIVPESPLAAEEKPMTVKKPLVSEPDTDVFDYAFSNAPQLARHEPTTSDVSGPSIRIRITAPTDGF